MRFFDVLAADDSIWPMEVQDFEGEQEARDLYANS